MIRRLLTVAVVATLAVTLLLTVAETASSGQVTPPSGSIDLVSQTPWVDPVHSTVFDLRVRVNSPVPDPRVVVNVFARLHTRSDFDRTMTPDYSGYVLAQPIAAPLDTLHPDAQGAIDISIPVTDDSSKGPNFLDLDTSGVYPVSVELRDPSSGVRLVRVITTMLYTTAPPLGPRLSVSWVVPVHTPPPATSGNGGITQSQDAALTALVNELAAHPSVAATLQITPDTLAGLDLTDRALVSLIGRVLSGREVLAQTWVPLSLPAMLAAGLGDQASLSLARSTDLLTADLGTTVAGQTWVEDGPIDDDSLSFLRGAQFDRVVLPEADLGANPSSLTPAQPFVVSGSDNIPIRAGVADAGLEAHFSNTGDPVLAAHQLLADLFQIYNDAPSDTRGVIVVTPRDWVPNASFLGAWLSGLEASPALSTTTIDDFFDQVPPTIGRGGGQLVRPIVADDAAISVDATNLLATQQRNGRAVLNALVTALPTNSTLYPRLERTLLEVPSVDFSLSDRRARLDALNAGIQAVTHLISIGGPRTITLTARTGKLPLNVVSASDEPVEVLLRVVSDKLELPDQSSSGRATFLEQLHKGDNPLDLTVTARTPGTFAVDLAVLTPNGTVVMTETRLTVQSTALSGVGIVLSVGAALFLIAWWVRHAWLHPGGKHTKSAP